MSEKLLKPPAEVIRKALAALQDTDSNYERLATDLQMPIASIQGFFAGELIAQTSALRICQKLNILPQPTGTGNLVKQQPQTQAAKPTEKTLDRTMAKPKAREVAAIANLTDSALTASALSNLSIDSQLDELLFDSDPDDQDLVFEVLPEFTPAKAIAQSSPSAKGFLLLEKPDEDEFLLPLQPLPPLATRLAAPMVYKPQVTVADPVSAEIENYQNQDFLDFQDHLAELVAELSDRLRGLISERCGKLRVLEMSQAVDLNALYVEAQVWEKIPSRRWLSVGELQAECNLSVLQPYIFSGSVGFPAHQVAAAEESIISASAALAKYPRLVILGKPGAGKTSLLKHLACQFISGKAVARPGLPVMVPLFITLRDFAQTQSRQGLTNYVMEFMIQHSGIDGAIALTLLKEGRFLLLLDGLDEVEPSQLFWLTSEISNFAALYPVNVIAITSRNPVPQLEQFTEVELADFDLDRIEIFVKKWFQHFEGSSEKATPFLHQMRIDRRLQDLAGHPLLLTLQCLAYNQSDYFVVDVFRESLAVLLRKWQVSKSLSANNEIKLSSIQKWRILGEFAFAAIARQEYFFSQANLEQGLQAILDGEGNFDYQFCDLEALVQNLIQQHGLLQICSRGIYSFSRLVLQEYLAAKWVAESRNPAIMHQLLGYVHQKNWHSVFVFVAGMLPNADQFLQSLQSAINASVDDPEVQKYLAWADEQATLLKSQYKPAVVRAMYCDIDFEKMRVLDRTRALEIAHGKAVERARLRSLGADSDTDTQFDVNQAMEEAIELDFAMDFAKQQRILLLARLIEPKMDRRLGWLGSQMPDPHKYQAKFMGWWRGQGAEWARILRETILQHRKTIKDWNFNEAQLQMLRRYHYANTLLIECLNGASQVSPAVQQQIESFLLKPIATEPDQQS